MIEKKSIDIAFYEFESRYFRELADIKSFDGILFWQIIKRPLFYKIIHANKSEKNGQIKKTRGARSRYLMMSLCRLLYVLCFRRQKQLLVTTDFRRKRIGNETVEVLIDSMIESNKLLQYTVAIQRRYLLRKDPPDLRNRPAFDLNMVYYAKFMYAVLYKEKNVDAINNIYNLLLSYLKSENIHLPIDLHSTITDISKNHYLEKRSFLVFLRIFRPKVIYAVDSLGTGFHHAANQLNIVFNEIQHGFISDYKVDYIIHPKMIFARHLLLLPSQVFLFGDFYKNILLTRSIWQPSDLSTFHRIDSFKRTNIISNRYQTFFYPHQWVFYEETISIIHAFGNSNKKLKIKFHPNEDIKRMHEFAKLCETYENIELIDRDISTFEAVKDVDYTIGFFTTMLLETASMNVPTITLRVQSDHKKTSIHDYVKDQILNKIIQEIDFDILLTVVRSLERLDVKVDSTYINYLQE